MFKKILNKETLLDPKVLVLIMIVFISIISIALVLTSEKEEDELVIPETKEEAEELMKEEIKEEIGDSISEWEKYVSDEYGFEISYPKKWAFLEDAEKQGSRELLLSFIRPSFMSELEMSVYEAGGYFENIDSFISAQELIFSNVELIESEEIDVSGYEAKKMIYSRNKEIGGYQYTFNYLLIVFKKDDRIYSFFYKDQNVLYDATAESMEKIVDSIKFI